MCYAKPGPRCSHHAYQALKSATQTFNENPTAGTYTHVLEARTVYESTPQGLKALAAMMELEPYDSAERDLLYQRYVAGEYKRETELAMYRELNGYVSDEDYEEPEEETFSFDSVPRTRNRIIVDGKLVDPHGQEYISNAFTGKVPYGTSRIDYSSYCTEEERTGECTDPYCHDQEVRIHSYELDTAEAFSKIVTSATARPRSVRHNLFPLPEQDMKAIEEISKHEIYPKVSYGYYGAEGVDLVYTETGRRQVQEILDNALRENPNVRDADGVLAYTRAEGFDTTGLTPRAAVEALVNNNPYTSKRLKEKALKSTSFSVSEQNLKHDQIVVPASHLTRAGKPYNFGNNRPKLVGVVWHDESTGKYYLVDGHERFNSLSPVQTPRRSSVYGDMGKFIIIK